MSATPRPWAVGDQEVNNVLPIVHKWLGGKTEVAQLYTDDGAVTDQMRANARLIVISVNAFEELLAVAKAAATAYGTGQSLPLIESLDVLDAAHPGWRRWR